MTLAGIVMLSRLVQLLKALILIDITLPGIFMLSRLVQYIKAKSPIDVTPFSITIVLIDEQLVYHGISLLLLQLFIAPVPVIVNVPLPSRLHVRFVPHEPLLIVSANATVGTNVSTMQSVSIMLKIRFFIGPPPIPFPVIVTYLPTGQLVISSQLRRMAISAVRSVLL